MNMDMDTVELWEAIADSLLEEKDPTEHVQNLEHGNSLIYLVSTAMNARVIFQDLYNVKTLEPAPGSFIPSSKGGDK